jgi:lysozyme
MNDSSVRENGMRLAIPLIEDFEGYRDHAYQDSVGVWTIGFGTTRYPNGHHVQKGDRVTREEADDYLLHDLARFADSLDEMLEEEVNEHEYAALLSFEYNLGAGALAHSTLMRYLNAGDHQGAARQILRWNKAGGHVLAGLTRRRQEEMKEFTS